MSLNAKKYRLNAKNIMNHTVLSTFD